MIVEQLYTGCLAQGAYYIESAGEVAIIDPLRETTPYVRKAESAGATIKYIFETHFHADFVSGHLDLTKQTGAPIVYGPNANTIPGTRARAWPQYRFYQQLAPRFRLEDFQVSARGKYYHLTQ